MKRVLLLCVALATASPSPLVLAAPKTAKKARVVVLKWPKARHVTSIFTAETAAIQYLLRAKGFYKGKPDGIYGPQTKSRIMAFQRAKGLKVDGVVGPQTWPKLIVTVKRGSKGDAVRAAQTLLRDDTGHEAQPINPTLNTDGTFGAETEKATRISQYNYNFHTFDEWDVQIAEDGIVGPQTWCALVGGEIVKK